MPREHVFKEDKHGLLLGLNPRLSEKKEEKKIYCTLPEKN